MLEGRGRSVRCSTAQLYFADAKEQLNGRGSAQS
jgi:hypothetical protein